MDISSLLHAPLVVQLHVYAALLAAVIGAFVLWRRKGTRLHKALGRLWVLLMLVVAGSSFFIHTIRLWGPFSPIHILSIVTIVGLAAAIGYIRSGDVAAHRRTMQQLYAGALGIAGFFTLLPGRLMSKVVFGAGADARTVLTGMVAIAAVAAVVFAAGRLRHRRATRTRIRSTAAALAVALVLAGLLFHATPVLAAAPHGDVTALSVVTHTPVWVWLAFALVLWLGYSRTRDRVVPVWRLVILPLVVVAFAASNLAGAGIGTYGLAGLAIGAIAGLAAGLAIADHGRTEYLGGGRLKLKGEWLSFVIVLLIFAIRYVRGATLAIDPAIAARPGFQLVMMAVSGFSAALLIARTATRLSVLAR